MDYFAITDIGKYRQNNEDYYFADGENNLFIVADGMGGHNAGEIASKIAVDNFSSYFLKNLKKIASYNSKIIKKNNNQYPNNLLSKDDIQKLLINSAIFANKKIYTMGIKNIEMSGMGTTFTSVYIFNNKAYVLHIGDSRLYIYRKNEFNLITEDHTLVYQLYKSGAISYEDTFNHPQRNYLTSILGENEISTMQYLDLELLKDDILLLCSDGLNSMVKDKNIKNIIDKLKKENAQIIANKLVSQANINGGKDNITVIVIKI